MIPPTRPNITRLTDESVMVRWSVPPNEGLPIEFFKVQYKEADKRGSRWKTIDEDIPSHIRSYEVSGLRSGQSYRFRIAAVYSNNDNKLGPNSGRFLLEKEAPKRKPGFSPVIEIAEAVSQSAIMIQWKVRRRSVDNFSNTVDNSSSSSLVSRTGQRSSRGLLYLLSFDDQRWRLHQGDCAGR